MARVMQSPRNRFSTSNRESQIWQDWLRSDRAANVRININHRPLHESHSAFGLCRSRHGAALPSQTMIP